MSGASTDILSARKRRKALSDQVAVIRDEVQQLRQVVEFRKKEAEDYYNHWLEAQKMTTTMVLEVVYEREDAPDLASRREAAHRLRAVIDVMARDRERLQRDLQRLSQVHDEEDANFRRCRRQLDHQKGGAVESAAKHHAVGVAAAGKAAEHRVRVKALARELAACKESFRDDLLSHAVSRLSQVHDEEDANFRRCRRQLDHQKGGAAESAAKHHAVGVAAAGKAAEHRVRVKALARELAACKESFRDDLLSHAVSVHSPVAGMGLQDTLSESNRLVAKDVHEAPSLGLLYAVVCSMAGPFCFGYALGFTSPVFSSETHSLNADMNMGSEQITWFGSVINLGAGAMGIMAGFPVDKFGKKFGMVTGNLFYVVGWAMMLSVKSVSEDGTNDLNMLVMYVARIVIGCGIGFICCSTAPYQAEISTLKLKGIIGCCFQFGVVAGIFVVYALGLSLRWRSLSIVCLSLASLGTIGSFFLSESPAWLASKGRFDEAEVSLRRLRSQGSDIDGLMDALKASARKDGTQGGGIAALLKPPRMKACFITVATMSIQQASGVNAVMFYASTILGIVWTDPVTANRYSVGAQALQLVMTGVTAPFMDRAGRRPLLLLSSCGMLVTSLTMCAYFFNDNLPEALVVVGFYGYIASFAIGVGPIPWSMLGELNHPEVKGIVGSLTTGANWFISFGITKTIINMQDAFGGGLSGMGWVFVCYASVLSMGIVFFYLTVPETKGKSYAQVEAALLNGSGHIEYEPESPGSLSLRA
ncbi:Facilitated trehalose transporter Tret1 [Diplonema papillatum]|nr:Facilitated trehalose transporter Tret1 [Diplonema papillatum]